MALPSYATRRVGLGRRAASRAGRCQMAGQPAKVVAAGEPQWISLCAGPRKRQAINGKTAGEEAYLGQGDRQGWTPGNECEPDTDKGRDARVSIGGRRD